MRFWLTHSTEISIRDQIARQVSVGILSGELAPGEKLPSVRALARRFSLHPNTVSAAYRQLHEEGWVSVRRGSGVYARESSPTDPQETEAVRASRTLNLLLGHAIEHASRIGLSHTDIVQRLDMLLATPQRLVLVEPDHDLANLILFEIASAGRQLPDLWPLKPELFPTHLKPNLDGRVAVVLPSKAAAARAALGDASPPIVLEISPVASSTAAHLPQSREHLVAVVSHWPRFLEIARTMLISAGFAPESLLCRDARKSGWAAGLDQSSAVVCDSLTRLRLPAGTTPIVFTLLTSDALDHFPRVGPL